MRGRRLSSISAARWGRNTPAYAGKTTQNAAGEAIEKKHPRVCGEDDRFRGGYHVNAETPPRMRGRRVAVSTWPQEIRNTPAYAGKTMNFGVIVTRYKKHPRVCGEDQMHEPTNVRDLETPPRMRGRQ